MDSRKLALLCRELADNKKAEDIVIMDVRELSSVTDYFVIASGTSADHQLKILAESQKAKSAFRDAIASVSECPSNNCRTSIDARARS